MCPAQLGSPSTKQVAGFPHTVQTDDSSVFALSNFGELGFIGKSFSIASFFGAKLPLTRRWSAHDFFCQAPRKRAAGSVCLIEWSAKSGCDCRGWIRCWTSRGTRAVSQSGNKIVEEFNTPDQSWCPYAISLCPWWQIWRSHPGALSDLQFFLRQPEIEQPTLASRSIQLRAHRR